MRIIALTSIPPRFAALAATLDGLLRQGADDVVLTLPRNYDRFRGATVPPPLPGGVTLLWSGRDHGPATKLLPALRAYPDADIACCDDDWTYAPGWLDALCAARRDGCAVTGSGWSVARLGRQGASAPLTDIAQGFSGLLVRSSMFGPDLHEIPPVARDVDDVWISGHLALSGVPLEAAPESRALCTPRDLPGPALQDGPRAAANRATAAWLNTRYGIWPRRRTSSGDRRPR